MSESHRAGGRCLVPAASAVVLAVLLGTAGCADDAPRRSAPAPTTVAPLVEATPPEPPSLPSVPPAAPETGGDAEIPGRPLTAEDGVIADGAPVSPFAEELPAIAELRPELRAAVQSAATAAAADGVELLVTSGWRSAAYQQQLFDAAVAEHGSPAEARRYVLGPAESEHVTGDAVDIGRTDATSWLSQHGADHGLCQTYANESWHYELATTPGGQCPAQLRDASAG